MSDTLRTDALCTGSDVTSLLRTYKDSFTDVDGLNITGTAVDPENYAPMNVHVSDESYWTAVFYNDTYK